MCNDVCVVLASHYNAHVHFKASCAEALRTCTSHGKVLAAGQQLVVD
jgi:hypothetical protein